jgi:4-cresol dehydrogenase (hydroxylating)
MAGFRTNLQFGSWNGSGGLYGTRAQVAEARRLIRKALKGKVDKLQFLDDRMLRIAGKFSKPLSWLTRWDLSRALELVKPIYGLMKGIPTDHPLKSAYWRKRSPVPQTKNPDQDGCGLLWCAPVAPATGAHATRMSAIVIETLLSHGFEPMISITLITERALTCVATISYDRHVPGEDEKARACLRDLLDKLSAAGYYSYRLGIQSMEEMTGSNGYNDFLRTLKAAIDPHSILAPGRYEAVKQKSAMAGQAG